MHLLSVPLQITVKHTLLKVQGLVGLLPSLFMLSNLHGTCLVIRLTRQVVSRARVPFIQEHCLLHVKTYLHGGPCVNAHSIAVSAPGDNMQQRDNDLTRLQQRD